ncbi:uncharacterized protein LOC120526827 [Polypterus senegalus]|uniref:uncharacterized protein LOC120526827 n=1 Tax=Polypterus senegalus TaxID=55291 RepID=UPI0019640377|nr:uncharacterized protein LOC120526827 [Polypterus senegalus]
MARHISILKTTEEPTVVFGAQEFACLFCYKRSDYAGIISHLQSHKRTVVVHGGFKIYKCSLNCQGSGHYHCCYCQKTVVHKDQFLRHLSDCGKGPKVLPLPSMPMAPVTTQPLPSMPTAPVTTQSLSSVPTAPVTTQSLPSVPTAPVTAQPLPSEFKFFVLDLCSTVQSQRSKVVLFYIFVHMFSSLSLNLSPNLPKLAF